MKATLRTLAVPIVFLLIALPAGIGLVMAMGHHDKSEDQSAFSPISRDGGPRSERRAQARWERVATIDGNGSTERSLPIAARAIQWRADWSCESGNFRIAVGSTSPGGDGSQSGSSCPASGRESATAPRDGKLRVAASGAWRVVISQQVDTALEEPPLAGMTDASRRAGGRFHGVQKYGEGSVSLHRLANGRLALRFEHFFTSPSPGLRVWLSRARDVSSTLQARQSKYTDAGAIRSTLGTYNQMLPAGIDASEIHSIVIWCPTVLVAFSAAPLASSR